VAKPTSADQATKRCLVRVIDAREEVDEPDQVGMELAEDVRPP